MPRPRRPRVTARRRSHRPTAPRSPDAPSEPNGPRSEVRARPRLSWLPLLRTWLRDRSVPPRPGPPQRLRRHERASETTRARRSSESCRNANPGHLPARCRTRPSTAARPPLRLCGTRHVAGTAEPRTRAQQTPRVLPAVSLTQPRTRHLRSP